MDPADHDGLLGRGRERPLRTLLEDSSLLRTSNAIFFKISYAIQR